LPKTEPGSGIMLDFGRRARIGLTEAVLCESKSADQISEILLEHLEHKIPCLLTRLSADKLAAFSERARTGIDYDRLSQTAFGGGPFPPRRVPPVGIVSGGTSDARVCAEAARALAFHGVPSTRYEDIGVAGLWRLQDHIESIRKHPAVIVVAGMEGALFSVLGGLVSAPVIAVPTSVGYGVARDGQLSLYSALGSCAPGVVAVNIDNGYGAACAVLRLLNGAQDDRVGSGHTRFQDRP